MSGMWHTLCHKHVAEFNVTPDCWHTVKETEESGNVSDVFLAGC